MTPLFEVFRLQTLIRMTSLIGLLVARLGRDSFDVHQTIAPYSDVLRASSRFSFFSSVW